jgi:hypothetical protein
VSYCPACPPSLYHLIIYHLSYNIQHTIDSSAHTIVSHVPSYHRGCMHHDDLDIVRERASKWSKGRRRRPTAPIGDETDRKADR